MQNSKKLTSRYTSDSFIRLSKKKIVFNDQKIKDDQPELNACLAMGTMWIIHSFSLDKVYRVCCGTPWIEKLRRIFGTFISTYICMQYLTLCLYYLSCWVKNYHFYRMGILQILHNMKLQASSSLAFMNVIAFHTCSLKLTLD